MSLFPAYSEEKETNPDSAGPSWLNYPCQALKESKFVEKSASDYSLSDNDSSTNIKKSKRNKTKIDKGTKKNKRHHEEGKGNSETLYIEDSEPISNNAVKLNQVKLTKPSSKITHQPSHNLKKKKRKKRRYFSETTTNKDDDDLNNQSVLHIDEFMKRTEEFNKQLRLEPYNVPLWLEYVRLQDLGIGTSNGKAEKKLSILDRALEENNNSEDLLNEKMNIFESIYPFEKVCSEAKSLLTKYPQNPVGWRWLTQVAQYSLSKMTAPGVLQAYEQVLEGLHRVRQHNTPLFLDALFQCMLFLRQAGLWEHLWLITELYLELTYTTAGSGAFKINVDIPEQEIQNLEDTVLTSGLPLGALWLRTEHLRECVHFAPVLDSPDPQRVVFVDDLSGLLFPLGGATYSRLMCLVLVALKVPPLPMSDAFYDFVGLKSIPWSLDSPEILLTASFPSKGILKVDAAYLEVCRDLLIGPQYLNRERVGAKEFFDAVDNLFNCCTLNCAQEDLASLLTWRIRWWTYTVQHTFNTSHSHDLVTTLRNKAKTLLKKFRHCLPLFTEYALYEAHVGDFDIALKVLETAIELQAPPLTAGRDRKDICALYKVFVELLLQKDFVENKERVIKLLIAMSYGEPVKNITVIGELTMKALDKISHVTTEIMREMEVGDEMAEDVDTLSDVALIHEQVSWISCNAWFLYLVKDVWQSGAILEKGIRILENIVNDTQLTIGRCILEHLYETLLSIMNHFCHTHSSQYQVLQEMIERAIKHFPNNTYFLNLLASMKITTAKWQTISSNVINTKSPLACVILIFIWRAKLFLEMEQELITKENAYKRILNLLKKMTKEKATERCPLIWKLTLQSTSSLSMEDTKNTFFLAIEKCPWIKMLYYEAAKMLPEDMPQIQDLLVEKELRLHITPEELEILREENPESTNEKNDVSNDKIISEISGTTNPS